MRESGLSEGGDEEAFDGGSIGREGGMGGKEGRRSREELEGVWKQGGL